MSSTKSKRTFRRKSKKKATRSPGAAESRIGFLTVGQTARILGISASTLRLWENVGLISPARSSGKYRLYSSELLEVLKRIKYLRDVKKLSVPGIKQMLGKSLPILSGFRTRADEETAPCGCGVGPRAGVSAWSRCWS